MIKVYDASSQNSRVKPGAESVWVVIAAYNEATVVRRTVDAVAELGYQIVVVDDGSGDETFKRVEGGKAHLLRHCVNLGAGAALQTGMRYALDQGARYIVGFDADGQHDPEDIATLIEPLERGECDVTLGSRFMAGGRVVNMPRLRRGTLRVAVWLTRLTTGLKVSDTHNGMRGFSAQAAGKIRITQNRYSHCSQLFSEIKRLKLRCREVPVTITYTEYSLRKGQKLGDALHIVWESLMEVFRL